MKLKKIFLFALCLVAVNFSDVVFCQSPDRLAPNVPDADIWDKLDISHKTILIGGLLVGYRSGVAAGAASEHRKLKNNTTIAISEAGKLIEKARTLFYKPISYYVKQTDSFLQTFPGCKKMKITELLDHLASAWADSELKEHMGYEFIQEVNYEDVEKACQNAQP